MNHFILTRFNLKLWWKADKKRVPVQTEEWLKERFRLFDTYTFPSLQAQTDKDFKWICLLDENTPDLYRSKMEAYSREMPQLIPIYCGVRETRNFPAFFKEQVLLLSDKSDKQLITTYLDSDDAVREDFVEDIKRRALHLKFGSILSYVYGIQYYESIKIAVRIPYINNHFLSYYESLDDNIRTVWGFWHYSILEYKNINFVPIDCKDTPMWIEVIHARNVDNDVKMTLRHHLLSRKNVLIDYGLKVNVRSGITSYACFYTLFIIRFIRQLKRRAIQKINNRYA